MEHNLDHLNSKIHSVTEDFAHYKGEFLGISETVVNKDITSFKLDRVTK